MKQILSIKVAIFSFVALIGASMAHGSIVSVDPTSESYFWWNNDSNERTASQLGGHGWTIEGRDPTNNQLKPTVTMTDFTDTGFSLSTPRVAGPNKSTSQVHYKFSVSQNWRIDIYLNSTLGLNENSGRIFTFGVLGQAADFRPTMYDFTGLYTPTWHYTSTIIAGTTYEFFQNYVDTAGDAYVNGINFNVVLTDPAAPIPTPGVITLIGIVGLVGSRRRKD